MTRSTAGSQSQDDRGKKDQKPWVHRIGPPLSPVSVLLVIVLIFLAAVVALSSSGCTTKSAVSTETDNFTVGQTANLKVNTLGGRIEIIAGSDNVVAVRAELRDIRRIKYEAIQSGNDVIVTAEKTGTWWFPAGNTRADIYVTVPANTSLILKTQNGAIDVRGTTAGGILETTNGAITLADVKGDFDATTKNGAVDVDTIDGSVLIKSTNGMVSVREAKGSFNLRTKNGNVTFSGELTSGGSSRLVTVNGDIEVELTGTPSVHLDASTKNGKVIHDDIAILATRTDTNHVIGSIGTGEADLYIETSNGDVTIE